MDVIPLDEEQTVDNPNPIARFAHQARLKDRRENRTAPIIF